MINAENGSPTARLSSLVRELLAKRSVDRSVAPEDDLIASGLSSLDLVNLMLGVEAEFDLTIPAEEITMAAFGTVGGIATLVRRLAKVD